MELDKRPKEQARVVISQEAGTRVEEDQASHMEELPPTPGQLKKRSVFLILLFTFVTLGLYIPFWFLTRRKALNSLTDGIYQVSLGPCITIFVLYSLYLLIDHEILNLGTNLEKTVLSFVMILSAGIIQLVLSFRVRAILNLVQQKPVSAAATFFLTIFYLQYRINRLSPEISSSLAPSSTHPREKELIGEKGWWSRNWKWAIPAVIFFAGVLLVSNLEESKVVFGPDEEIYYEDGATETDARSLGSFFQEIGFFDGTPKDVWLAKTSTGFAVSLVVREGAWDEPEMVEAIRGMGSQIREQVFDGRPVDVLLTDEYLSTKKVMDSYFIRTLKGHTEWVYALAFTSDGRLLASESGDETVKIWEVATGQELHTLTVHQFLFSALAFSPDGRWLASGGRNDDPDNPLTPEASAVKLWDVSTGREVYTLIGHGSAINAVAFSPDGRWLASASTDETVNLWDVATWQEVYTLTGHTKAVKALAFSPNGNKLATGGLEGMLKVWDVTSGQEIHTLTHTSKLLGIMAIRFSEDGNTLASASDIKEVKFWDVATGQELRSATGPRGPGGYIESASISPDLRWLVAEGVGGIKLWEIGQSKVVTLFGHEGQTGPFAFTADGSVMASGGADATIKLWEISGIP